MSDGDPQGAWTMARKRVESPTRGFKEFGQDVHKGKQREELGVEAGAGSVPENVTAAMCCFVTVMEVASHCRPIGMMRAGLSRPKS